MEKDSIALLWSFSCTVSSRDSYLNYHNHCLCFLSALQFRPQEFSAFSFIRQRPVTFQLDQSHVFLKIAFDIKCTYIVATVSPCHQTRSEINGNSTVWLCFITFSSQRNRFYHLHGPQVSAANISLSILFLETIQQSNFF